MTCWACSRKSKTEPATAAGNINIAENPWVSEEEPKSEVRVETKDLL